MRYYLNRVVGRIGTTLEHGTQEQINGSERFPPARRAGPSPSLLN